jgi:acyl-CoA thioesterase
MTRFDRDTGIVRLDAASFEANMSRDWWISRGPNGGYVSATVLRAMAGVIDDPERAARSFTVHFTAPPSEGPVRIETALERSGRSMTTVTARLLQDGRLCALGIAAFSRSRSGPEFQDARMPEVVPPERAEPIPSDGRPMRERYETRSALPALAESDGQPARSGGWIRLREPQPADPFVVAALADAWPPAARGRGWPDGTPVMRGFPTVDITVHFRATLPHPDLPHDAFLLAQFQTRFLRHGFLEEDGEIWTPDGTLLAHSRQLGVLLQ